MSVPRPVVVRALPGNLALGSLSRALSKVVAASERVQCHREISSHLDPRELRPGTDAGVGLV